MHKRHINEFRRTSFADAGRAAGTGISEENYSDESMFGIPGPRKASPFQHHYKRDDGEVIIIKGGRASGNL